MRRSWKFWSTAAAGLAVLTLAQPLAAQSAGASLAGRTTDEQGGALPGTTITVKSSSTGFTRTVATGGDGSYRFASLIPDTYDVTASLSGFKTVEEKGVVVNVATTRTLNFTMPVAAASAVVTVTAEAPLVRQEPAIGTVVSQKELENAPVERPAVRQPRGAGSGHDSRLQRRPDQARPAAGAVERQAAGATSTT